MELTKTNISEVSVRLLNSGRYVWTITAQAETKDYEETIEAIKKINAKLKDSFPFHPQPGSGRVAEIDED